MESGRKVRTFKFLGRGAAGPFSGQPWTTDWRSIKGALALARNGFHVCREGDLAFWIHDELWEVEIAGATLESTDCLVAERARLVRRVTAWDKTGARRFADACIVHAASGDAALLEDAKQAAEHGYPAIAAYSAARATADLRAERVWQSGWLAKEIVGPA